MTTTDKAARAAHALRRRISDAGVCPLFPARGPPSRTGAAAGAEAGDRIVAASRVAPVADLSDVSPLLRSIGRAGRNWTNAVLVAEVPRHGIDVAASTRNKQCVVLRHDGTIHS